MDSGRKAIKALAREAALLPQEELLQAKQDQAELTIGIPAETSLQEKRVALVPEAVALLVAHGHQVLVETQAGAEAQFSDNDYSEAGARIVYDRRQVFQAHIVLKVEPPSLEEVALMGMRQVLISALQLSVQNEGLLQALSAKKTTAIAWDFVQNENGIQPLVRAMGEIAGNTAVLVAGELMASVSGQGTMLGGVSGVRPSEVVILGAGTVGEFATRSALGLGASVKVFDNSVHRLIRLQNAVGQGSGRRRFNPRCWRRRCGGRGDWCRTRFGFSGADARERPMIAGMREHSIVVDVSIDRGGVFETSRLTSHERPTFVECGVIHYCVPNIPSRVSRTASKALSNLFAPMLLGIASEGGVMPAIKDSNLIATGVYMFNGTLTHEELAADRNLPWKPLDLLTATMHGSSRP